MTSYNDYMDMVQETEVNIAEWYGDFGITIAPVWQDNYAANMRITWPGLDKSDMDSARYFAEALAAACYEAAKLTGYYVDADD